MAATLCLCLLLMAMSSIASSQVSTLSPDSASSDETTSVTLYLSGLVFTADMNNPTSIDYQLIWAWVQSLLTPTGADLEDMAFGDGGGCLQVWLRTSGGDIAAQSSFFASLEKTGLVFSQQSLEVSLTGCPGSSTTTRSPESTVSPPTTKSDEKTTVLLYLSGLVFTPELNNSTSGDYLLIWTWVQTLLTPTGAVLEDLTFGDGGGCLQVWLQTSGGDIAAQTAVFAGLAKTGVVFNQQSLNVSLTGCRVNATHASEHMLVLQVYVSGLPWQKGYTDMESTDYKTVEMAVTSAFQDLKGKLLGLVIVQIDDCLLLHTQWQLETMDENVMNLIQRLISRGLKVKDTVYGLSQSHCSVDNTTFCNFLTQQACGSNGKCVGNSAYGREWEMCSCNEGFGGLFCEYNKPDKMSECERMRRFSLFIHHQITGEQKQLVTMNTTMKEIMAKLRQEVYSVPYCFPSSSISRENFYSSCEYSATNGQKLRCYCLSGNGNQNFWEYFAEDDCRVYNRYLATVKGEMFIHNLAWSNDLMEKSELYTSLKYQIERYMSPAGGNLSELVFSPWGTNGCVHINMVYRAVSGVQARTLLYSLPGSSLMVKDENKTLSLFPCREDIDINVCPEPLPGSAGICLSECGANDPCEDGLTCCNNACGQGICKELGFLQKMKVNITITIEYVPEYDNEDSVEYKETSRMIIDSINWLMTENRIDGYSSIRVLGMKRAELLVRADRRKRRQAPESDDTLILCEFLFTKAVPVEQLMDVRGYIMASGFNFSSTNYEVLNIGLGRQGECGDVTCFHSSICVDTLGGQAQCACPRGRAGSDCGLAVCQNPDGSSMCENNAQCRYDESMYGYRCHCETGFHGKYCETNVCDLFKPGVCNDGSCVGDITAMELCNCPPGKGGLFCQYNVKPGDNLTYCEKHHAFASYVVAVLNGSDSGSQLRGDVSQLFPLFNSTRGILMLPTCRYDNPFRLGEYHYFCGFDTSTGRKSVDQDCLCANGDGTPNYWTFHNGQCVVYVAESQQPCDRRPCANGGVCHNMPNNDFSCTCSSGFHGRTCENHHRDQCPHGGAPLYRSYGLWTCGDDRPCPVGFHCHGDSFNGSCCFKPDFLCDLDLCQNGASCIGDLHSGQICYCPPGKTGLFCDKEDDGVKLTQCQKQQQLTNWLEGLLRTGLTPQQTTLEDLRRILIHIGITYLPTDRCDDEGAFRTKVDSVSVLNVNDVKELCFDENGDLDPMCKDEVCGIVQPLGICKNGGRCIGDFSRAFCDCTGTGFHGPRCGDVGEDNRTDCVQVRDLVHFALRIANGSEQIIPGIDISGAVHDLFELTQIPLLFEPYCDDHGQYAYKGCAHFLPALTSKLCYCTSEDWQQVGDDISIVEPPEICPMGPDQCPHEWGPECVKPDWWCTHEMQCTKGEEKCYFAIECDEEECSKTPQISCVPTELKLPCEPQPCKHNKYKMCPPCGEEASCFHVTKGDSDDDDDEDKEGMGDKNDDNDSEEKHAGEGKGDDDNDSGEESLSWMKPPQGQNYICECPTGRSGPNCEVYDEICRTVPPQLCPHGCIGDLENGVLCRCPEGYAGLLCETVARTQCEIKQAFFGDSLNVLRGLFTIPGYESSELKKLVQFLVYLIGADSIPETNCTENGFYEKVQCDVNVYDLDHKYCSCVNQRGDHVSSNILPHIGFDVCTGPIDVREWVGLCFQQGLQICQNEGSCVFDLYEGKICDCPPGFSGQLCEKQGEPGDDSESFCEFMRDAYYYSQAIVRQNETTGNSAAMYLDEVISSFIEINSNRTAKGHDLEYVGLKWECQPDGNFKYYVCDYDLLTDKRVACYCLGHNGPLIGTEAADPESLDCSDVTDLVCHELDDCPYLECEHGHRHNLQYCPICECRHPCEGHKCHRGERCVVEDYDCDKLGDEMCTKPVCVPVHKPGVCPGHKPEDINSIQDSLMSDTSIYDEDTCQVRCHDDADCKGSKKCCGLCGNACVEPEESDDCTDQYEIMMEYLEFIRDSRNLTLNPSTLRSLLKTVDQTADIRQIWVPKCKDSNYVPVQCMYNVSALLMGYRMTTECFCVDRQGHRIKGSVGQVGNESSCDVKPFSCPTLHPSTEDDAIDECVEDMDCVKGSKCCHDGFHHVCSEPVPEPANDNIIDTVMANVCVQSPDICPSGPCMSTWESDGKVCECDGYPNMMGPFCEIPVSVENPKPRTACERKRLTTYLFWLSFEGIMTSDTDPQSYSTIDHIVEHAIASLLEAVPENERAKISILLYACDEDGNYEPMQCDSSMYTGKEMECFCVDEEGKELPGTRKPQGEPLPFCRRQQQCDMGHILHGADGSLVMCDKDNKCPNGYSCSRGMYGNLYCCPNGEEHSDICNHPVDMGFECADGTTAVNYYYRGDTDSCESFDFKGCGGNRNRFESMDNCIKRCKDKMHFGSCPSSPFKVAKTTNCYENQCETDSDCPSDRLKCCSSTCGQRCIPAIDESPAEGRCPVGRPKSEPETCAYSSDCGGGYKCHFKEADVSNIYRSGYCCLDVENINYCQMKPLIMEEYRSKEEMDDEEKEMDDEKKEMDDDEMSEHGCEKLRPRYYYNQEDSQCEMYHGCEEDFNSFETREDCCTTCSIERRCKQGRCPSASFDVAVSCTDECINDYDCQGQKICCNTGCSLNCVSPHDELNSTCFAEQREAKKARGLNQRANTCDAVYIPKCEENGDYARQQCHSSLGICWCVTSQGNYISSSLTKGVASCHHYSEVDIHLADAYPESVHDVEYQVCPQDEQVHCCAESFCEKRCHAHPEAMCRINPCGGCRAEYFDADNNIVSCEEGLTSCQLELQEALRVITARSITARTEREENEKEEEEERRREMAEQTYDWDSTIRTDIPLKCQKPPETGNCKGFLRRWFYNPQTRKCSMFIWGMCGGNSNRFRTPKECYDECDSSSNPCATVRCGSPTPECTLTYDEDCYLSEGGCSLQPECSEKETNTNLVDGVFIPRCTSSGAYNNKQCHGDLCWCVHDDGEYAGGLSSTAYYGDLRCTASGPTVDSVINLPDCPAGSYANKPQPECLKACSDKVCPGNTKAECVVDLCSESCTTMFKDEYGSTVDCEEDKCQAFSFDTEGREHCTGVLCDGENVKNCPNTVCENARERLCPQNPCAVCMVDSCTCEPYFMDVISSELLDQNSADCKYLSKGSCTVQTCRLMLDNVPTDQLPQCTQSGSFRAKQCRDSVCYCVGAEGNFVRNVTANGNCEEIDEIAKIEVKLVFNGDFDSLQRQGKLPKVKEAVRNYFINELGVPEENIYYISEPYRGSVGVDTVIQENKDDPTGANIGLIANSLSQEVQNGFDLDVDGEKLSLLEESTFVLTPSSLVDDDDDDDDGLSDKEIIIIAACGGGVGLLLLIAIICCCCCRGKKEPEVVDDTYDHIRERTESDKNIYDNPTTMYNNKSFESEGHYMDLQDDERYMKVHL